MSESNYDDIRIDEVACNNGVLRISWSTQAKGFGQLDISVYGHGEVEIDHEFMSKEFCIAVMTKFVEKYYTL